MPTVAELGTNMSLQDLEQQAKARVEEASAIEQKFMDAVMPKAEDDRVRELLTEADTLHALIEQKRERQGRFQHIQEMLDYHNKPILPGQSSQGGTKAREMSPGDQFTRSGQYLDLKNRGILDSSLNRLDFGVAMKDGTSLLEWKTILFGSGATSGGSFVQNDVQSRVVDLLQREINLLDIIPRLQTSSDTIEYVQQSTFTNSAAFTAEATGNALTGTDGRKPESALAYATVTAAVKTLAHWLPVTNRMLSDAPQIRGVINSQLLLGLQLVLAAQVISGDGTGENLTGILNTANVQVMARGSLNEVDAIFTARTMARTGGKLAPTAVLMNPVDYQQVRLLRENAATGTLGQYLMGPPNTLGMPTVWGLPVVEDENIAADTVLVGNWVQGCSIFDREQSAVRVGMVNDNFIRNIQTILAETRLAFVVWRPSAFVRVTGY